MLLIKLWPGLSWAGHCTGGGSQLWLSRSSPLSITRLPWGAGWGWGREEQMAEPPGGLSRLLLHRDREPWSPKAETWTVCGA